MVAIVAPVGRRSSIAVIRLASRNEVQRSLRVSGLDRVSEAERTAVCIKSGVKSVWQNCTTVKNIRKISAGCARNVQRTLLRRRFGPEHEELRKALTRGVPFLTL
jgi:hypothetical protein